MVALVVVVEEKRTKIRRPVLRYVMLRLSVEDVHAFKRVIICGR